ncbi:MAG: 50S ribosomal protein L25 [Candidatus Spechtbacterales bacterium]
MLHLTVKPRDPKEQKAKDALKEGYIPGVVYGPKMESTSVSIRVKKFNDIYKKAGETTLIALDMKGEEGTTENKEKDNVVLIRDIQRHPVKGDFTHVDFYQLPMDQPIEITVPINGVNEAPGVKEQGGVLVNNLHEVDIKALPKDLIQEIEVDLSVLENIEDSILVKDLNTPGTIEILADEEEAVFAVEAPREEEPEDELEEAEEGADDQIAEIKTEGEEKREEREAEKEEE